MILDRFLRVFERTNREEVYCQTCGDELTDGGGCISDRGNVYCEGRQCGATATTRGIDGSGARPLKYSTPRGLQRAITNHRLMNFGHSEHN